MSSTIASATASASSASSSAASLVDHTNKSFKIVGICLAVASGVFIGSSFVIKKKGLILATAKYGNSTGEGHGYLKSWIWWVGMSMMVVGEILNFVAYAFTEAILVTPMGALSVVICAILSHFFLKESLNFFGWIGCVLCIIGATILALNAPEQQSVTTINAFKHLFLSVGFLVWASLCIVASLVIVFYVAPRWGKKNMMPYITICSLIGGISVSCTQGLGSSIVTSIQGNNQVKNWFFWFLFVFVVITLLIEINYLNKALELFNTSLVVPVYFCFFSTATLTTSFILYQGLKASAITLITMVLGFLVICLGITLLQLSKVDPAHLQKLDRKSTMLFEAAKHQTEEADKGHVSAMEEPGMDALRGGFGAVGSIIRARSVSRRLSSASSYGKYGPYESPGAGNLSTHGLGDLQRYQLSDNPMPHDAMDRISMHTKSPTTPTGGSFHGAGLFPSRSKSHVKFEEADVGHSYGYHNEDHYRQHPHSAPPLIHMGNRQNSSQSIYPPVIQEEDVEGDVVSAPLEKSYNDHNEYLDPYSQSRPALQKNPSAISNASHSSHRLANLFHFSHSADPSKHDQAHALRGRGGGAGGRNYPHLKVKDYELESEERAALVSQDTHGRDGEDRDDREERGRESYEDEPKSAVTDEESLGHVLKAERRPVIPISTDLPPGASAGIKSPTRQKESRDGPSGPRGPRGYGR